MIDFEQFKLPNGLEVIVHSDHSSPIICLNVLYKVGSRNESPDKTGFAHLFEHLMFGGSQNIPSFDEPLQAVGGDNNAFTNNDITNYYTMTPATNVETAFWLESDRMLQLSFDPDILEVQRHVVIEEFKQRYLNQPYGDVWLRLSPEAFKIHPYQWPTIGKDISHIEKATMDDVKSFFSRFYHPSNAVLVIAGDISSDQAHNLTEKWFGTIPTQKILKQDIPQEPEQTEARKIEIHSNVPQNAFYKVYHMPGRGTEHYHAADLLSDLLGRGKSSLLHQQMVKKKQLLTSVSAYVTGSYDPGLLVITGKLNESTGFDQTEKQLDEIMLQCTEGLRNEDVEKVKNLAESSMVFGEVELLNRSMGLAYAAFLGDPNFINIEPEKIKSIKSEEILEQAAQILRNENSTTLFYHAE